MGSLGKLKGSFPLTHFGLPHSWRGLKTPLSLGFCRKSLSSKETPRCQAALEARALEHMHTGGCPGSAAAHSRADLRPR